MPSICASVRHAASREAASSLAIAHRSWGERPAAAALPSDNMTTPIAETAPPLTMRFVSLFRMAHFLLVHGGRSKPLFPAVARCLSRYFPDDDVIRGSPREAVDTSAATDETEGITADSLRSRAPPEGRPGTYGTTSRGERPSTQCRGSGTALACASRRQ